MIDNKLCIVTDIDVSRRDKNEAFNAVKRIVFEGLSLAFFNTRHYHTLSNPKKQKLLNSVSFTSCKSAKTKTPGDGYKHLLLLGACSVSLFEGEIKERDLKSRYGEILTIGDNGDRSATILPSAYSMVQWVNNVTHKASESGINRATHYVRTAYQVLTDTVPLRTTTEVKFALNVSDVQLMASHVQATKFAYFDVETFPAVRNVPKEKRLEYNTTFFRALCRTLQVSHQVGAAWTVPIYDFESPLNVGKNDDIKFGIIPDYEVGYVSKNKYEPEEIQQRLNENFTIVPSDKLEDISKNFTLFVKRNGDVVTQYDWEPLPFRLDFAVALRDNWQLCVKNDIDNYFKQLCFPIIESKILGDESVEKVAHNATFDMNVCRYASHGLGFDIQGDIGDTMEMIHTLDKSKPGGLKPLSELYYPEFIGYGENIDYENDSLYDIGVYGGIDTDLGARLYVHLIYDLLKEPKLYRFYENVKKPNIFFFADLEFNGCYIDRTKLEEVKALTTRKANKFKDKLDNIPEVQNYVVQRLKKEREQAIKIINLKLSEWSLKTLRTVEARLKKAEDTEKAYKKAGGTYKAYQTDLGKKAWLIQGIETGYFNPKSPYKYQRALNLQQERLEVNTGQAKKAYLFEENITEALYRHGTYYVVDGVTKYITSQKKELFRSMNYNSTEHLGDFVYLSEFGLQNEMPVTNAKETDPETGRKRNVRKQRPTTTRKEITSLPDPTGFLNALMIYKALNYVYQSCEEIEYKLDDEGYIHTQYGYVNTDRSKSSRPNLQNVMQRSPFEDVRECVNEYKSMFTTPPSDDPDEWLYYKRDLSQAELRWFCFVYRILSMALSYDNNEDLHEKTTAKIMGISVEKLRNMTKADYKLHRTQVGKGNNFGNIYGISAKGFQEYVRILFGYTITLEEAERQQRNFFELFPEILPAHKKQRVLIHKKGYSETPFGNRRPLPDLNSPIPYFQAEAERHGINQPVQGAAGVAMMFSAVIFKLRAKIIGLKGGTINLIHDDIPGYMKKSQSYRYQLELRSACNNPPFLEYFGFEMDIAKMQSDAEVGKNWYDVSELPDMVKDVKKEVPEYTVELPEEVLLHLYPKQQFTNEYTLNLIKHG